MELRQALKRARGRGTRQFLDKGRKFGFLWNTSSNSEIPAWRWREGKREDERGPKDEYPHFKQSIMSYRLDLGRSGRAQ
jgi:hypothetical protein